MLIITYFAYSRSTSFQLPTHIFQYLHTFATLNTRTIYQKIGVHFHALNVFCTISLKNTVIYNDILVSTGVLIRLKKEYVRLGIMCTLIVIDAEYIYLIFSYCVVIEISVTEETFRVYSCLLKKKKIVIII